MRLFPLLAESKMIRSRKQGWEWKQKDLQYIIQGDQVQPRPGLTKDNHKEVRETDPSLYSYIGWFST